MWSPSMSRDDARRNHLPWLADAVWWRRGSFSTQTFTKQDLLDDRQIRGELVAFLMGERQIGEP